MLPGNIVYKISRIVRRLYNNAYTLGCSLYHFQDSVDVKVKVFIEVVNIIQCILKQFNTFTKKYEQILHLDTTLVRIQTPEVLRYRHLRFFIAKVSITELQKGVVSKFNFTLISFVFINFLSF
ncbi:Hypothetical_protein [Hexamita inflata]|uniref:Hypothetical_protein n=1 Tax=Hexamita inflata TaxID=28002 RepID=A0AA86PFQ4_9EUKA|nr:Hypothetical protein HINF_LOCUS25776 [Hexamita inflata]